MGPPPQVTLLSLTGLWGATGSQGRTSTTVGFGVTHQTQLSGDGT